MSIEWDGEGLPPVGCKCELFDCEAWNPVIIKYIGDKYVTTHRPDLNSEVVYCVAQRPEKFRPIRTEAERRREDRIKALNGFIGGFMKSASGDYSNLGEALFEWLAILDKVNDTRS